MEAPSGTTSSSSSHEFLVPPTIRRPKGRESGEGGTSTPLPLHKEVARTRASHATSPFHCGIKRGGRRVSPLQPSPPPPQPRSRRPTRAPRFCSRIKSCFFEGLRLGGPGGKSCCAIHDARYEKTEQKDINCVDQKYCNCSLIWHAFRFSLPLSVVSVDLNLDMRNAEIIALSSKCSF